jgi:hypothetical protein
MIRKMPALGLDPRVETGFPKKSCSDRMRELGSDSTGMDRALANESRYAAAAARFLTT